MSNVLTQSCDESLVRLKLTASFSPLNFCLLPFVACFTVVVVVEVKRGSLLPLANLLLLAAIFLWKLKLNWRRERTWMWCHFHFAKTALRKLTEDRWNSDSGCDGCGSWSRSRISASSVVVQLILTYLTTSSRCLRCRRWSHSHHLKECLAREAFQLRL